MLFSIKTNDNQNEFDLLSRHYVRENTRVDRSLSEPELAISNSTKEGKHCSKRYAHRKLSAGLEDLKKQGYPFSFKVFPDLGHGGLIGENTERFIEEVDATHRKSLQKAVSLSEVGTE